MPQKVAGLRFWRQIRDRPPTQTRYDTSQQPPIATPKQTAHRLTTNPAPAAATIPVSYRWSHRSIKLPKAVARSNGQNPKKRQPRRVQHKSQASITVGGDVGVAASDCQLGLPGHNWDKIAPAEIQDMSCIARLPQMCSAGAGGWWHIEMHQNQITSNSKSLNVVDGS